MRRYKYFTALFALLMFLFMLSPAASAAQYKYDKLHRLTEVVYDNGTRVSYSYDPAGNILSVKKTLPLVFIISADPVDKEENVQINKTITIRFNEEISQGELFEGILLKDADGARVGTVNKISGSTLTVTPDNKLKYAAAYTLVIPSGAVKNSYGRTLASEYTLSFKTRPVEYGDVNGDGFINSEDSSRLKDYVLNGTTDPMSDDEMMAADVDGDGKITSTDYAIIKRRLKTP